MQLVLNKEYGGFHFNKEMTEWLKQNRNWTVLGYQDKNKKEYPVTTLIGERDYFSGVNNSIELRSHKDLIDCVKELKKLHENDKYPERYYGHIHGLKIVTIEMNPVIQDYHDGKERVQFDCQESYDD